MYRFRNKAVWGISLLVVLVFWAATIVADDDRKKHRNHESRHTDDNHHENEDLKPVRNSIYADQCGACHFAYQPELMPAESWKQVLDGIDDLGALVHQLVKISGIDFDAAEVAVVADAVL